MIRDVNQEEAAIISRLYNHYIDNTIITFEETPVAEEEMRARIEETTASLPWLVIEEKGAVAGFAYASQWKSRCAYRYSVETTIYIDPKQTGRGLGKLLYKALIDELRKMELHSLIAGISLPNPASVALHEKMGFEQVAHFKQVGFKFGRWIDVGYWELIL